MLDSLALHLQPFFAWLLHTTWHAGVLVCLILLAQKTLGHRIGVRGSYCLWLVLLIRLVMPWTPPSPVSVHNLLPAPLAKGFVLITTGSGAAGLVRVAPDETSTEVRRGAAGSAVDGTASRVATARFHGGERSWWEAHARVSLLLFWLAGVCSLAGYILVRHVRLWRVVRRKRPVADRKILGLLADCQRQMGTNRAVGVVALDGIGSPALFGLIRPRLLLPDATLAERNLPELRHIFLHELAHLKRYDILLGCIATLVQVLHWFNPLVALGLRRMRADRELVCDGLALSVLAPEETAAYGRTIIHQIERLLAARPRLLLAGLSGDKAQIKQRIAVISQFRKETYRRSPLAMVLVAVLACAGLTDGLIPDKAQINEAARDFPTSHQDKHANIVRIHIRHRDTGKYLVVDGEGVTCDANEPGDAGLWEARFDDDFGNRDQTAYFYSVTTCKYLTSDKQGNLAVNGLEPDEAARWCVFAYTSGARISPYPFAHFYLRPDGDGGARVEYGTGLSIGWDIDQLWRVKTSDNPKSNPEWRREHVPGPD